MTTQTAEPDTDPYADSPDVGNTEACSCGGAWHAMQQHCIDWPCPGCTRICPPEPGTEPTRKAPRAPTGPYAARRIAEGIAATGAVSYLVVDGETERVYGRSR
jgi:hypothetical protein